MIKGCVIGDPVKWSTSLELYPQLYAKYGVEGTFKKKLVPPGELEAFFIRASDYDFITVTMPHKITVMPVCDTLSEDARAIGSVNYIAVRDGRLHGCNFDGVGALDAIEKTVSVSGKRVIILGAGGSTRSAIYEAKKRGAHVVCVNRTFEKALSLSQEFGVDVSKEILADFDVLINSTSVGMDPLDQTVLVRDGAKLEGRVVLDMASRKGDCVLARQCKEFGCSYISGFEMFYGLSVYGLEFLQNFLSKKLVFDG